MFLGNTLVKNIILPATNVNLPETVAKIEYRELLQWIGMWLLMSTSCGYIQNDYWLHGLNSKLKSWKVPYDFNNYMSKRRPDKKLKFISFTTYQPPNYLDKIWQARQMIDEWNRNVQAVLFHPRWAV